MYEYHYHWFLRDEKYKGGNGEIVGEITQLILKDTTYEFRNQQVFDGLHYRLRVTETTSRSKKLIEEIDFVGMNAYKKMDDYIDKLVLELIEAYQ